MKKLLALALSAAMTLSLAACGSSGTPAASGSGSAGGSDGQTFTVGVCQLAQHPALDAATQGFVDALKAEFGDAVDVQVQNAGGEVTNCSTIINGFVSNSVDLILANATSPLTTAASATSDIPILGTSVTDYASALEMDNWTGTTGRNISGTTDLAPMDGQAAMLQELFPDAKTVGLLYCSAEANSQYQVDTVQAALEALGLTCTQYPFSDTNDMASVTQTAADNSDVLYVPTDNTIANNTGIVDNICHGKIPVFAGEEGVCSGCGVATLSISYYDLGVTTGQMAVKILTGESNVAEMPIEYAPQFTKKYNPAACEALGLAVPEGYEAIA